MAAAKKKPVRKSEKSERPKMAEAAKKLSSAPATLTIEDGIATILLDDTSKKVNTLSSKLFEFFEDMVKTIASKKDVKGIVVASGKADGFVAGADIEELQGFTARHEFL